MKKERIEMEGELKEYSNAIETDGDCIIYFDSGESCKWSDEVWPFATATHFSRIKKEVG